MACLTIVVAFAFLWLFWPLPPFAREMRERGFPKDYALALADLHERHPTWTFEPLLVDDMDWSDVVDRECTPGWNLVVSNAWAPGKWLKSGLKNYTPYYAKNARAYDSGSWYQASRAAVAYFLDPRNFLNEDEVFMFETIRAGKKAPSKEAVEEALAGSFMRKSTYDGGKILFSDLILDVSRKTGVSAVFLAARLKSEQGGGTVQAMGKIGDAIGKKECNGIYNLFNSGACGTGISEIRLNAWREATSEETRQRYGGPWTSQEKAIRGGAQKIRERYVDCWRDTSYLQKFSVAPKAGSFRWKQYMQNIAAPLAEARSTAAAYRASGELEREHRFIVPVFKNMPGSAARDPARGDSVYSAGAGK